MRVAGIMSGTSLDGIDVAIVDINKRISTLTHSTTPYSAAVRQRILNAQTPAEISRLNFELGELYARAVIKACKRAKIPVESLELIGSHGQTIYHEGSRNTLQIGEAAVIAERLGVPVVSDFRTRDIAAGGQGAPLVPFVDALLFSTILSRNRTGLRRGVSAFSGDAGMAGWWHRLQPVGGLRPIKMDEEAVTALCAVRSGPAAVALNIGGIANITILPAGIAFDTGPGNMVIDQLVDRLTNGKQRFDRNGAIAAKGHINRALLDLLLADKYYKAKPPKTAGREQYGSPFVDRLIATGLPLEDLIATATALTAATIAAAIPATSQVIASGGGIHNRQLMAQLAAFLPNSRLTTTAEFGIDPDAKEAIAFAILAHRTWHHRTGNLPSATGARKPVILGKVTFQ